MKKLALAVTLVTLFAGCRTSKLYPFGQYSAKYIGDYDKDSKNFKPQDEVQKAIKAIVTGNKSGSTFTTVFYNEGILVYSWKYRVRRVDRFLEPLNTMK